jgi:hypothetical protein
MRDKELYLLLLSYCLVEIRHLQVDGNMRLGPDLADVFHNVPEALRLPWTAERDARVYAQMKEKAHLYGLDELLERWEQRAHRRLKEVSLRSSS